MKFLSDAAGLLPFSWRTRRCRGRCPFRDVHSHHLSPIGRLYYEGRLRGPK